MRKSVTNGRRFFVKKRFLSILCVILSIVMMVPFVGCESSEMNDGEGSGEDSADSSENVSGEKESSESVESSDETDSKEDVTETESESASNEADSESESESKKETETEPEIDENYGKLEYFTNLSIDQLVPGVTETAAKLVKKTYNLSKANAGMVRVLGRAQLLKNSMICDHSAAGFEVQGFMSGEVVMTATSVGDTYYTVYVDGVRLEQRIQIKDRKLKVTIAKFEGTKFHTIKVLKQSESAWSTSYIESLAFEGALLDKPKNRDITIEVLGDSLTTGYGNLGVRSEGNAQGGNTPLKQDATQSYGFLAAEKLNADCNIVAWSGVGLDIGWTHAPFDTYYERHNFHRESKVAYDYSMQAPDVLIVHLGANDFTYERDNNSADKSKFVEKGIKLVEDIRKGYNKNMPVIWAYDPDEGVPHYIKKISDHFGGEASGFYILELEWQSTDSYWGASGHPSVAAHEKHAQMIVDLIKEKNILG